MVAPKMKITYFDFDGLAEPVRFALAMTGETWEDKRITSEQFDSLKAGKGYDNDMARLASFPFLVMTSRRPSRRTWNNHRITQFSCSRVILCRLLASRIHVARTTKESSIFPYRYSAKQSMIPEDMSE